MIPGKTTFDTSAVVRLLVRDPYPQYLATTVFLDGQIAGGQSVYIADLVLSEAYFAMQRFYGFTKSDALAAMASLAIHPGIILSSTAMTVLAIPNLATAKPGFVDRLIHGTSQAEGHTLVTFEKAARKLAGTHVLAA